MIHTEIFLHNFLQILLKSFEKITRVMFLLYYIESDVSRRFKSSTTPICYPGCKTGQHLHSSFSTAVTLQNKNASVKIYMQTETNVRVNRKLAQEKVDNFLVIL